MPSVGASDKCKHRLIRKVNVIFLYAIDSESC